MKERMYIMKMKMRKVLAIALAAMMVLALCVTASAAGTGSITITPPENVDADATITYNVYKVFDADGNGKAISYKLVSGKTAAPACFTVDGAGNVSYSGTGTDGKLTQADIDEIAAYVAGDAPVATVTSTGGADAVAANLPNGYYYITTTTGTVVTIDSTNPNAEVEDKNIVPGVDKTITGASSLDEDGKKALAQVGTVVDYKAEITVGKGQKGYVFKDTMGAGLVYVADSLSVEGMTVDTDYTLTVSGQNITVTFKDDAIKDLAQDSKITVTYKATVTSDALTVNAAKNTATISYGNNSEFTSEPSVTEVYNAKFTVTKKDGNGDALKGAGFVIANAAGKYYNLTNGVVTWVDSIDAATEYTSDEQGAVTAFTGLANGTYTLIEKTVPSGYNKAADSTFTVEAHDYSTTNLEQAADVTNNSGSELPSTGGIGTTMFYVVGGVLVAAAVVILVSKKRAGLD
jgi:fimbrial isopeptide formation D2 family protein/LPXTG-motif cell wall-anchored protein